MGDLIPADQRELTTERATLTDAERAETHLQQRTPGVAFLTPDGQVVFIPADGIDSISSSPGRSRRQTVQFDVSMKLRRDRNPGAAYAFAFAAGWDCLAGCLKAKEFLEQHCAEMQGTIDYEETMAALNRAINLSRRHEFTEPPPQADKTKKLTGMPKIDSADPRRRINGTGS